MKIGKWVLLVIGLVFIYRFVDKDSLMYVINQSLPPREAVLMAGMLLGDRTGFDKDFYQSLINSGLVHLVIVSGSNVMLLIGGLIETMAAFFGRKKMIIAGMGLGWGYAAMVGWEVPVVRAMLMLSLMYWAQLLGRLYNIVRGLIVAGLIMIIGEVRMLTSVSFWLSIMAYIGVVTVRYVVTYKDMAIKSLKETIWVSLWITPILAIVFGKISIISPITNLLVVGIVEVITFVGAVGSIIGLVIPVMGKLILWLVYPLLKYFAVVAGLGGEGWWSTMAIKFNWWMLMGWYLILIYYLRREIDKN